MPTPQEILMLTVREMLGENIPLDGDASDTLFTDVQVQRWIDSSASSHGAAYIGWQVKMAEFAGLVSVTDGAASRAFSDLFDHAKSMVSMYQGLAEGPTSGRSRVGKIVRL